MAATDVVVEALSESEHRAELRKAVIASTVGTTIEWYDFLLYSIVTPLVFGRLFFPHSEPLIGVLEAFSIYFVGFVGRPIGAFIFGHYGDRIGRKAALIATLLITGLATFAVGFVPGYDSIGIWGAVLLTVIRMIQGIGVGGEWGGSVLFSMEWARTNKHRGFITSWPQFGGPAGLFLANIAVLIGSSIAGDQFFVWGWRIPFWLSIIMVGIGLYIRLGIMETPVFRKIVAEERVEWVPAVEVMKRQPKQVFLAMFARSAEQGPAYIYLAFIFAYNNQVMHMVAYFVLTSLICAGLLSFITFRLWAPVRRLRPQARLHQRLAADRDLRLRLFRVANSLTPSLIVIAIIVSFIPHDIMYGPQAALISEQFTPRLRYSGTSIGYQLASLTAGGPAPLIATALFAAYHLKYGHRGLHRDHGRQHRRDRADEGLHRPGHLRKKAHERLSRGLATAGG